ncbi:MAG: ankyrin repeat domain-containing protein [Candidatus Sabulitectum sp.]|nr:ankyrin repeat domain-containing protein [Candidatus Sabulitectum sp.]
MALFSGSLKKMQIELSSMSVDWDRVASLSSGRYNLSGKNTDEGKILVSALIKKAAESNGDDRPLAQIFRNITSKGGDLNRSMSLSGETPLHMASGLADSTLLKSLLEAGIQPVSTTRSGATALHAAITAGLAENVKLLLAAGADPGAEDATSNAPLHFSVRLENPVEIVKMLLDAGAKAYHRNSQQKTSVDIAEEKGKTACLKLLRESLRNLRKNCHKSWNCQQCGNPIRKPSREKVDWYISLDMWDYLQFTCGECGHVTPATVLDGEV